MKDYKILFTDLDGTLIDTLTGKTFPEGVWDMKLDFVLLDCIKKLNPLAVFIVSNQGGIEKGHVIRRHFNMKIDYITVAVSEYLQCTTVKTMTRMTSLESQIRACWNISYIKYRISCSRTRT